MAAVGDPAAVTGEEVARGETTIAAGEELERTVLLAPVPLWLLPLPLPLLPLSASCTCTTTVLGSAE